MPQRIAPWDHQRREFDKHWLTRSRALFWQPRTGKTKAIIDKACALFLADQIDGVMVIAPNGVHRNWTVKQLPLHHWKNVPYHAYAWRTSDDDAMEQVIRLSAVSNRFLPWLTINMEVMHDPRIKKATRIFIQGRKRFFLVFDESHHFATPGSLRTKSARVLQKYASFVTLLTGTSVEETPLQAYAQFQILEPNCLGFNRFEDFQDSFAVIKIRQTRTRTFPAIVGYKNLDVLKERIAPYTSVVLRSQCEDIPAIMPVARTVEPTDRQRELFLKLKQNDFDTLKHFGFQAALEGGAMLTKLQQVEGGFLKTPDGVKLIDGPFNETPKFKIAIEELRGYNFLLWSVFRHEIEALQKALREKGIRTGLIYGGSKDREKILEQFDKGLLQGIVAHPSAIGEGYDISAAELIYWYSQTASATIRNQANERASKAHAKKKVVLDATMPKGTDDYYLSLTDRKTTLADDISRYGLQALIERLSL